MTASRSRSEVGWQRQTSTARTLIMLFNCNSSSLILVAAGYSHPAYIRADRRFNADSLQPCPGAAILSGMNLLSITCVIVIVGAGCGSDKARPPPLPPEQGIVLVNPGTEPRRLLRYWVAKGTRSLIEMEMDLDVDAGGQGGPLPTLTLVSEIVADDMTPDGLMKVRTTMLEVAARDRQGAIMPAAPMTENMQAMRGFSITGTLSARGTLHDVALDTHGTKLPPALADQLGNLRRGFEQTIMPLPAEPVGVGASWRYKKTFDQNGMKLRNVTDVVVTAVDKEQVSFDRPRARFRVTCRRCPRAGRP